MREPSRGTMARVPAVLLFALAFWMTPPAGATVIERVVAVVDDKPILLTDLRARAKPFLVRIYTQVPAGAQRTAAVSQVYASLVERLVEDELKERAARRARITITGEEIDSAFERIARQNGISAIELINEATRTGLSEAEYRLEVRRQLLEAKLINLRFQGRIQVSTQDIRSLYQSLVLEERRAVPFRIAQIALDAPMSASPQARQRSRGLAEQVVRQARAGADFAELARRFSADPASRAHGGLLEPMKPGQLPAALDRAVLSLPVGEISAPIRIGDQLLIIKVVERPDSKLPSFREAEPRLRERAYMEKMNRARQQWLNGLRRQTHVDVRL